MESLPSTTSRTLRIALMGVLFAFAWLVLSVVFGFGAGHAHADDSSDRGGLLSGVTNTAGSLVTTVTDVVSDTAASASTIVSNATGSATSAVTPAVEALTTVAPDLPVAPVLDAAGSITSAVADVTGGGVVAPIVNTVVDAATTIPVVGSVVSGLELDTAAATLGSSVDNTLHSTTVALNGAVSGVAAVAPGAGVALPGIPTLPGTAIDDPAAWGAASPAFSADAATAERAALHATSISYGRSSASLMHTASAVIATAVAAIGAAAGGVWDGAGLILGSFAPANSALSAPGGAGPGAWVLLAFGLFIAYRAWMRRSGPSNDTAPAAPAFSTDVSPD